MTEGEKKVLNAHEAPPALLKEIFKKYQKLQPSDVTVDQEILDFGGGDIPQEIEILEPIAATTRRDVFFRFMEHQDEQSYNIENSPVYSHKALPGLHIFPSLLPPFVQKRLLSCLLHRDLSNPRHKTNLHLHYEVPYPEPLEDRRERLSSGHNLSLFDYSPHSKVKFQPKDSMDHAPIPISKVMQKSLRWITLGGQYDWTNKVYPVERPPEFPADVGSLLEGLFPEMKPQAAIVNIYSPRDTLSLHRDVSEESDKGLVSISVGCDCLFVIGLGNDTSRHIVLRLRSGDGLLMSKESRFAWHGVPKILPDTCPSYLDSWPAESGKYEEWRGWMKEKRINLNVRQMYD